MPRKPKATVDIIGNLEVMSRDMSLPEAVRAEAAREFVRLKAKEQLAPAPAPVRIDDVSVETFVAALEQAEREITAKAQEPEPEKPRVNQALTESQAFAADAPERARKLEAAKRERERLAKIREAEANRTPTVEEYKAARAQEQARASREWYAAMGYPRMEFDEGLGQRP